MPRIKDLTGRQFGRLTAIDISHQNERFLAIWNCRCECGKEVTASSNTLLQGKVRSCGCLQREAVARLSRTHGQSTIPEYAIWASMLRRCNNPKDGSFENYGGRGITVSPNWRSFENFIGDMGLRPSDKHSLDRENNDLGYCKENCRWVTRDIQNRNHRRNRWIETPAGLMLLCDAAELSGINTVTLRSRLRRGWPPEKLFDPLKANQFQ